MSRKLYVRNLSFFVERDNELLRLFASHGTVRSIDMSLSRAGDDGDNGSGTAAVQMDSEAEGADAIAALNGFVHHGFALVVGWAGPDIENAVSADEAGTGPLLSERRGSGKGHLRYAGARSAH